MTQRYLWWEIVGPDFAGLDDEEILEFERRGGNIEILEHYCDKIDRSARREEIVRSFSTILDNERKHRSAEVFMEFVQSGGNLATLKQQAENRAGVAYYSCVNMQAEYLQIRGCCCKSRLAFRFGLNVDWPTRTTFIHFQCIGRTILLLIISRVASNAPSFKIRNERKLSVNATTLMNTSYRFISS